jgi:hypothetical protein
MRGATSDARLGSLANTCLIKGKPNARVLWEDMNDDATTFFLVRERGEWTEGERRGSPNEINESRKGGLDSHLSTPNALNKLNVVAK